MERHLTASAVNVGTRSERSGAASVTSRTRTAFDRGIRPKTTTNAPSLKLAGVSAWQHTLILTGALDHHSAHKLEAEIERLCEEGVTSITLDLRQLTYIDSIGVTVIAFRCGLCKRRGFDFAVIPGSPVIHRAFERAGVTELLPFAEESQTSRLLPALALRERPRDDCEQG